MPFDSLEVRWFFDGPLTDAEPDIAAWYLDRCRALTGGAGDLPTWPAEWRGDRYLVLPGVADMGIKAREGRFEIKGQMCDFGVRAFAGAVGCVGRWCKWSYDLGMNGGGVVLGGGPGGLADVIVAKKRLMALARLPQPRDSGRDGDAAAMAPTIGFELVRVRLAGASSETHWSVGFEAAPYAPDLHQPFDTFVADVLADWPAAPLTAHRSVSYPAWLARTEGS